MLKAASHFILLTVFVVGITPLKAKEKSFTPEPGARVASIVIQPNGKILAGGLFETLGGQKRNLIGRLNEDGSVDKTFNPGASGSDGPMGPIVQSLAVQTDGKILVGGRFNILGGRMCRNLGRLNPDGSADTTFNTEADDLVQCLAVQADGKILAGGYFSKLGGRQHNWIARLNADGQIDPTFAAVANDSVSCMAVQRDGKILLGGFFTSLGGQPRNHLGRLNADGSLDTTFSSGADQIVSSIALQTDGKILVAGYFRTLSDNRRRFLGRLNIDGSLDSSFTPDADDWVLSLAVQRDGRIVLGGKFTKVDGWSRRRIGRLDGDGSLDHTFNPGASGDVDTLTLQPDGSVLAGGTFYWLGGQPRPYLARLNGNGIVMSSSARKQSSSTNAKEVAPEQIADGSGTVSGTSKEGGKITVSRSCSVLANSEGMLVETRCREYPYLCNFDWGKVRQWWATRESIEIRFSKNEIGLERFKFSSGEEDRDELVTLLRKYAFTKETKPKAE